MRKDDDDGCEEWGETEESAALLSSGSLSSTWSFFFVSFKSSMLLTSAMPGFSSSRSPKVISAGSSSATSPHPTLPQNRPLEAMMAQSGDLLVHLPIGRHV